MQSTEGHVDLAEFERTLGQIMPTALDMIASVVESPGTDWDTYAATLEVLDQAGPMLPLAILRAAAGMATAAEITADQVRQLASPDVT